MGFLADAKIFYLKNKSSIRKCFGLLNEGDYKILQILGFKIKWLTPPKYRKLCRKCTVDNNKIVFCNFMGNGYGCNPKYIAQKILEKNLPYKLVWLVNDIKNKKTDIPKEIKLVKINSSEAWKELASAKIIISNCRMNIFFRKGLEKRKEQYYIQTWHGSLGIKKLDADVKAFTTKSNSNWVNYSKKDSQKMDYFLSNSTFESNTVTKALWFENEIKEFGHPRNDIFFKDNKQAIDKVKTYYNIDSEKKILLYVPSFRDNRNIEWYQMNYKKLLAALYNKYQGNWVILVRLHPKVNTIKIEKETDVINATNYPDIQELLVASDIAITDYSSCIFDFMLSRKPAFIFATDIEKYNTERGFYYPLESTPFPVSKNNDELCKNIENFDYEKYKLDIEKFLKEKGCIEDGNASERTVKLIQEIMGGSGV